MFESQRSGRRAYKYDRTDLLLLGGGGLFVLIGVALALGAWLDPSARRGPKPLPPRAAATDSTVANPDSASPAPRDSLTTATTPAPVAPATGKDSVHKVPPAPPPLTSVNGPVATKPSTAPVPVVAGSAPAPSAAAAAPAAAAPAPPSTGPVTPKPPMVRPIVPTASSRTSQPTAEAGKPTTTAAPDVPGTFLVQLGSFGQQENADRLAAKARALGFSPSVAPAGAMHRVLISGLASRAAAEAVKDSLGRALQITPRIFP